jgi:hypothetical protein
MAFDQSAFDNFQTGIVDGLENLDRELQALATEIVTEMRRDVPKNDKELMKSIKFQLDRYSFRLSMLEYGFYQNFGVSGTDGGYNTETPHKAFGNSFGGIKQPFGISKPISDGNFNYRSRKFGIPSRQFYDLEQIQNRLGQLVSDLF